MPVVCYKPFTITVIPGPTLSQPTLAIRFSAYSYQLLATNGTGPFSIVTGGLPTGLSMDSDGLITGTPTEVFEPSAIATVNVPLVGPRRAKQYPLTIHTSTGNVNITFYYVMAVHIVGNYTYPAGQTPIFGSNLGAGIDMILICQNDCGTYTFNLQFNHWLNCYNGAFDHFQFDPLSGGMVADPTNTTWILTAHGMTMESGAFVLTSGNHSPLLGTYNLTAISGPAVTGSFVLS